MQNSTSTATACASPVRLLRAAGTAAIAALAVGVWTGLTLAAAGCFLPWAAWLASAAAGLAVFARERRSAPPADGVRAPRTEAAWLSAAAILSAATLALSLPPSEWVTGGWDPGVYLHTASSIANGGGLRVQCPDMTALPAADRALFGRTFRGAWEPFLGMRMTTAGWISPQFHHAYPVLMAMLWPFGGTGAALLVNPLLNAACVFLFYLWASDILGRKWGLAAAALLALNPAQLWQARFGSAEMLAQFLVLSGIVILRRTIDGEEDRRGIDPWLGGACLGLSMLARYDAVLLTVPMALVLLTVIGDTRRRGRVLAALLAMTALAVHCRLHNLFLAPLYAPMSERLAFFLLLGAAAAVTAAVSGILFRRIPAKQAEALTKVLPWTRIAAAAMFAAWMIFLWYVRPRLAVDGRVLAAFRSLFPGLQDTAFFRELAGRDAQNVLYLVSIFGVFGFFAACAGVVRMILRARGLLNIAWLTAALGASAVLMLRMYHEPFMMFASRRLVTAVIPLFCLGVAAACAWLHASPRRLARPASVLVLTLAFAGNLRATAAMSRNREWAGAAAWFRNAAGLMPVGSCVVSDQPGFAAPLRFLHGHLAWETAKRAGIGDAVETLQRCNGGKPVYLLTASAPPPGIGAAPVASLQMRSNIQRSARHAVPLSTRPRGGTFTLYRIPPQPGQ